MQPMAMFQKVQIEEEEEEEEPVSVFIIAMHEIAKHE